MKIHKERLCHNFSRRADCYDAAAVVQQQLARQLVQKLQDIQPRAEALLEIGCGTGFYTALLRQAFPAARITAIDLAPAALALAQDRLGKRNHIKWQVGDGETGYWGEFDLVTANSVFQWFSRPALTLVRLYRQLRPAGWLAFSAFGPATFQELAASLAAAAAQLGLRPLRLPAQDFIPASQWHLYLQQAGFTAINIWHDLSYRYYPDFWDLLRSIQQTGATSTRPAFIPRRLLLTAQAYYDQHFRSQQQLQVSYETFVILAQKPPIPSGAKDILA